MPPVFVRHVIALTGISLLAISAACGPSDLVGEQKLGAIKDGMKLSEVGTSIGDGPLKPNQPTDSLRLYHGFRTQMFLVGGRSYRVLWYREKAGSIEEPITRENETPILLEGENVIGTGWAYFDKKADEVGIPNPYRSQERLDSISKAQSKRE